MTAASTVGRPRGRERTDELREVPEAERMRLAATFGVVLRAERGRLTQGQLAELAGVTRRTIERLETGRRRPTTTTTWKIAKALRPRGSLYDAVVVDERLRQAAGDSLRHYARRQHAARERVRAELLAEAAGRSLAERGDSPGRVAVAALARQRQAGGP